MSVTRNLRRVCNYCTWYSSINEAVSAVVYHKKLTRGQRKQWLRLPARKRKQLVIKHRKQW
ncbi:hypothetical protein 6939_0011 [Klebsiella phage 6939]|uniref:Uncharacterized protein n=1 Tax=Klebsiella phage 6939 TaxID=2912295 RepID=A0A9E7M6K6_9CAUD|nr:hypothetical protein 6939_0011 [Klebsiella phage 6939]